MKSIRNTRAETVVRCGQTLAESVHYTIEALELVRWQNDDTVIAELVTGELVLNDGTADISGTSKIIDFLRDVPGPVTVGSAPAYAAKTFLSGGVVKKLYARNTGFQAAVIVGQTIISHTATHAWAKLLGAEIIGCNALDTINFKVYDTAAGTYSGVPNLLLNQFGFNVNLPEGYYRREAPYDADIYGGMVLKLEYTSATAKTIGVNLVLNEVTS